MVMSCCAYGCTNRQRKGSEIHFFSIPLHNPELLNKWKNAINRADWEPTKYSKICSVHFVESDYQIRPGAAAPRLRDQAVPSLFPRSGKKRKARAVGPLSIISTEVTTAGELISTKSEDPILIESTDPLSTKSKEPISTKFTKPISAKSTEPISKKSTGSIPIKSTEPITPSISNPIKCKEEPEEISEPSTSAFDVQIIFANPLPITPAKPTPTTAKPTETPCAPIITECFYMKCHNEEPMETSEPLSKEVGVQVSGDITIKELVNRNKHLEWRLKELLNKQCERTKLLTKVKKQNLRLTARVSSLKSVIKQITSTMDVSWSSQDT